MKIVVAAVFTCICVCVGAVTSLKFDLSETFSFVASETAETKPESDDESKDSASPATQPAVIVSLAPSDNLLIDYKFIGAAVELPKTYLSMFETGMKTATEGMFHSKPAGALCYFSEELKPDVLLCLPVVDLGPFLDNLRKIGTVKYNETLITFEPKMFPQAFMMRHVGDYVFISDTVKTLQLAPADPESMFSDMASTYHAAVKIQFEQIPEEFKNQYKEQLVSQMKTATRQGNYVQPGDLTTVSEQLDNNLSEIKEMLIGLLVDQSKGALALDVNLTATDDSKIAQLSEKNSKIPATLFAGFYDDKAAVNLNICTAILPEDATQIRNAISRASEEFELSLPGEERETEQDKAFAEFVDEIFESLEKTAANSHVDIGLSGTVRFDQTSEIVLGIRLDDPKAIESNLRRLFQVTSESTETADQIKFMPNVAQVDDAVFHQVLLLEEQEDPRVFGPELRVTFGFGTDAVYLGLGENALNSLKQKMADSVAQQNSIVPAVRFGMRLQQFVKLVEPEAKDAFAHKMFMAVAGNDRMEIVSSMHDNTVNSRASFDTGLAKVIWKTAEAKMNGTAEVVTTKKPTGSTRIRSTRSNQKSNSRTTNPSSASSSQAGNSSSSRPMNFSRPKNSSSSPTRVRNNRVPANYHMIPQQTIPRNPKPPKK